MMDFWRFLAVEGTLAIAYQEGIFSLERLLPVVYE